MKKLFLPLIVLLLLLFAEIMKVYYIMPFPGSQQNDSVTFAYFLNRDLFWLRIPILLLIAYPVFMVLRSGRWWARVVLLLVLALYGFVFYMVNFRFLADRIFLQPHHKVFTSAANNRVPVDQLILGVCLNGQAKAYPIEIMGYHHQVQDTMGGEAIIVTYCTVCRSGRVYSPVINGKKETFRLVGMDHFNAMFEDSTTKSWWRQATGEAIAGPLKGKALKEIPSQQMTLSAWLRENPNSLVLQPDPDFARRYSGLAGYGKGTITGELEGTDIASWKPKSWVIGVLARNAAKAYDWNTLLQKQLIMDSMPGTTLMLTIEKDSSTFHVFDRRVNGQILQFTLTGGQLNDTNTGSVWNEDGICIEGFLKGQELRRLPAYQEFWHSWKTFHPGTGEYR